MRPAVLFFSLAALAFGSLPASAEPPSGVVLAPHRAVYNLSLLRGGGGSRGIDSAQGRIAFDFGGDACEGYTLRYRQVTILDSTETGPRTLDVRTATFESPEGKSIRFKTDSSMEGMSSDNVDGDAELGPEGIAIRLKGPRRESLKLPGTAVFPSEHLKRLIDAARNGQTTYSVRLYDGSDDGKKVFETLALIGRRIEPGAGANLEEAAKQEPLAKLARWPMTVSYFKTESGDQTPAYTISFELFENGISRALKLDYGDFVLKGDLESLAVLPGSDCQR